MDRETLLPQATGKLPLLFGQDSLGQFQRLADSALNHLGTLGVPVTAEVQDGGLVSLTLPLPWAHLFLNTLATQAQAYKEQLHQTAMQERIKQLERRWKNGEIQREVAERNRQLYEAYQRLRHKGLSDREALDRLRDPDPSRLLHDLTILREILKDQDALARGKVRRRIIIRDPEQFKAQVLHLAEQGMSPSRIAQTLHVDRQPVKEILRESGTLKETPRAPHRPVTEAEREEILRLARAGTPPKQIARQLHRSKTTIFTIFDRARREGQTVPRFRVPRLSNEERARILTLFQEGKPVATIAEAMGLPRSRVYWVLYCAGRRAPANGMSSP